MPLFFHDRVLHKDEEGFALWRIEHYLEHLQMAKLGLGASPVVKVPDYDFGIWDWEKAHVTQWLDAHENTHTVLRQLTNVSGVNLSIVNLEDSTGWYEWHDAHANEHVLLRQNLAIS